MTRRWFTNVHLVLLVIAGCSRDGSESETVRHIGPSDAAIATAPPTDASSASDVNPGGIDVMAVPDPDGLPPGICPGATSPDGSCYPKTSDDEDADGYPKGVDCDDLVPTVHPGVPEIPCDFVDDDCDGQDYCPVDADGDGSFADSDCNDYDASIYPAASEIRCNGLDEDCTGTDSCDRDGDGDTGEYAVSVLYEATRPPVPADCDDTDPTVHIGAPEIFCDGVDQDCIRGDCCDNDFDGDGWACKLDCNDDDPKTYPGAPVPSDMISCYNHDYNCDGVNEVKVCR